MGRILVSELKKLPKDVVIDVRGKGLLCAIVVNARKYIYFLWIFSIKSTQGIV